MMKLKVAQFFPKFAEKVATAVFYLNSIGFQVGQKGHRIFWLLA